MEICLKRLLGPQQKEEQPEATMKRMCHSLRVVCLVLCILITPTGKYINEFAVFLPVSLLLFGMPTNIYFCVAAFTKYSNHSPTMHFNYRYFETEDGEHWWFGGGKQLASQKSI